MCDQAFTLRNTPPRRHNSGFTLMEMVISIALMGILATVGSSMISDSFTTTRIVDGNTAVNQKARYALERLAREMREVKYASSKTNPATTCSDGSTDRYCITTTGGNAWTASRLQFTKTVSGADVTVTINYSNPNLTLQYSDPAVTSTLTNQVDSFSLGYLNATGTATTDVTSAASGIHFVVINLTVNAASGQGINQRTRVALRNN